MRKLHSGLDPVASATGAPPTIDELRARRAHRRSRRIATTSASALGIASIVAVALTFGGGAGNKTLVNTAQQGDTVSSLPTLPTAPDGHHPGQHPDASTSIPTSPTTAPVATIRPGMTTLPRTSVPGPNPGQAPPSTRPPAPAPTAPGAPTITSATLGPDMVGTGAFGTEGTQSMGGKGTVQVTWSPPASDGGSPITSYWVQGMYTDGGTGPGCRVAPTATTCLVKGLFADKPAVFYVAVENAVGSTTSAPSNTVTAAKSTPNVPLVLNPAIPGNNAATAGDGSATMAWGAPVYDGGSPITGYVVRSSRANGTAGPTCTAGASATSCVVGGLTNGTTYTFRVFAINAIGIGDPSIVSNAVTPHAP